jgi:DNA-binding SARP family transcriptional activator
MEDLNHLPVGSEALQVRLLGGFSIRLRGMTVSLSSRKAQGMLAILALSPDGTATRDKLCGLLWGDRSEDQARSSLRQSLVLLRDLLDPMEPGLLTADRARVRLDIDRLQTDATDLVAHAAAGRWREAADIAGGVFLDGLHLRDSGFEHWLVLERQRLLDLQIGVLERLAEIEQGAARVQVARRLVTLEPFREGSHRLLAESLAAMGERDQALRQLRQCEDLLAQELNVPLSPQTVALRQHLLKERLPDRRPPDPPGPPPVNGAPALEIRLQPPDDRDAALADLGRWLLDTLGTLLSKLPYLRLVQAGARDAAPPGADHLLDLRAARLGGAARLTARLSGEANGAILWSHAFDVPQGPADGTLDAIALQIATEINVLLLQGDQALSKLPPKWGLEPWQLVVQASTNISSHDRTVRALSRRQIDRALELDPLYSSAYTLSGWWHWQGVFCGWATDASSALEAAEAASRQGHALNPANPEPFLPLAVTHMQRRDFDKARAAIAAARDRGPTNAMVAATAANVEMFAGRPAEAQRLSLQAMRLCPVYPPWYPGDLAQASLMRDQYDEAVHWAQVSIARSPGYIHAHAFRVIANALAGREAEARRAAVSLLRVDPVFSAAAWVEGQPFDDRRMNDRFAKGLETAGLR